MKLNLSAVIALLLVMVPAMAVTISLDTTYGCGTDTVTITATGLNETNVTAILFDNAVGDSSNIYWTACTTGTYTNASYVVADASGDIECTATVATSDYGAHVVGVNSTTQTTATNTDFQVKCYEVTDLVGQGVDIAGSFMYELVDQSGNIAALVILGLLVTLLVGVIAAVGSIFVVFQLK